MFWLKLGGTILLAALSGSLWWRAAHPGQALGSAFKWMAAAVALLWLAAGWQTWQGNEGLEDFMGVSWQERSLWILALSLPILCAAFHVQRHFAPTRPILTGALCGALSGSAAAAVYALHCPEYALNFIAVWYLLGMALPTMLGALLGKYLLRW